MQQVMRPYATAGIALVGASMIAITPVAAPLPQIQTRSVKLVDAWSDLVTNTTANLDTSQQCQLVGHLAAFQRSSDQSIGVIQAFDELRPDGHYGSHRAAGHDLGGVAAGAGARDRADWGRTGADVQRDRRRRPAADRPTRRMPQHLYEGVATVLNAYLNGADNVSLLDGAITIPLFNGVLAPETVR